MRAFGSEGLVLHSTMMMSKEEWAEGRRWAAQGSDANAIELAELRLRAAIKWSNDTLKIEGTSEQVVESVEKELREAMAHLVFLRMMQDVRHDVGVTVTTSGSGSTTTEANNSRRAMNKATPWLRCRVALAVAVSSATIAVFHLGLPSWPLPAIVHGQQIPLENVQSLQVPQERIVRIGGVGNSGLRK